jgi:putative transposase
MSGNLKNITFLSVAHLKCATITMKFSKNELYHIYNRGNHRQQIFFRPANYLFFFKKIRKFLLPYCDMLAYCLMPNHFNFLINADTRTVQKKLISGKSKNVLSEGIKNLLSSYAKAINVQNKWTGSLFQQNTKAKCLERFDKDYGLVCFNYIHQKPFKARLVEKLEDWPYSSFGDYCGFQNETICICNKKLAFQLLNLNEETFYKDSYVRVNNYELKNIF